MIVRPGFRPGPRSWEVFTMRPRISLRALWRGSAVLAIAAMLMVVATPVAVAMLDRYGAGAFSAPYAPYTAPYETGPVSHGATCSPQRGRMRRTR